MADFDPPMWIMSLPYSDQIVAFLKDPRTWVVGIVYELLVGGVLDLAAGVLGNLQTVFGLVTGIPLDVAGIVISGFGAAGDAVLGMIEIVADVVTSLIISTGPFAPVVLALVVLVIAEIVRQVGPLVVETISPRVAALLAFVIPGGE
ncbi:hypothetical protein C2R22_02445 [Salinigranum rubrum]|uniref:Uncharacterized protein n=1 Tax=Salinigranum rubrum TaxID=755307 RepID=A0A2I8VFL1_9EURY|nr:hypothetical protein [Salinigranum rubrum]AUV80654.1 hypothetical protein C2R22_02445 [Salinigranum rubrum]